MPNGIRVLAVPLILACGAGVWGCKSLVGFGAVSISPIYGVADGCTPVTVSGHGFAEDLTVRIGQAALQETTWPIRPLDQGFMVTGRTPPGEHGFADVKVTVDGETSTLKDAFFFTACPRPVNLSRMTPSDDEIGEGTVITMTGCNLKDTYTVRIGDNGQDYDEAPDYTGLADLAITSVCSSAEATFTVPAGLAEGDYHFGFFDSTGTQVWPATECNIRSAPGSYPLDTADSTDHDPCEGAPTITIGDPS